MTATEVESLGLHSRRQHQPVISSDVFFLITEFEVECAKDHNFLNFSSSEPFIIQRYPPDFDDKVRQMYVSLSELDMMYLNVVVLYLCNCEFFAAVAVVKILKHNHLVVWEVGHGDCHESLESGMKLIARLHYHGEHVGSLLHWPG